MTALRDTYLAWKQDARAMFIATLRTERDKGRTLDDLAQELGVTRQAVHEWLSPSRVPLEDGPTEVR